MGSYIDKKCPIFFVAQFSEFLIHRTLLKTLFLERTDIDIDQKTNLDEKYFCSMKKYFFAENIFQKNIIFLSFT